MELTEEGARFAPRIFCVSFDEGRWAGLEARITDAPSGALVNLLIAAPLAAEVAAGSTRAITPHHRTAVELLIREFAPLVVEWNVDDAHGRAVHPDEGALRGQDFQVVWALFEAWRKGRVYVAPSPEEDDDEPDLSSIPMTPVPVAPG